MGSFGPSHNQIHMRNSKYWCDHESENEVGLEPSEANKQEEHVCTVAIFLTTLPSQTALYVMDRNK